MATTTKIRPRALVRASGGPRYAVALAVDALGTGMLRPFLLLYGVTVLRLSEPVTGLAYLAAATLAWSVHLRANPAATPARDDRPAPRMRALLAANVIYVFCLNLFEIALPLVLVTQLHASPVWSAAVFVANTVLVV